MTEEITKTDDATAYTFNWHDLSSRESYEAFLQWAVVHLVTPNSVEIPDRMNEISEASNNFTNVTLQVTINGVEVNAEHFLRGLHYNLKNQAERLAVERLEATAELAALEKTVRVLQGAIRDRVEQVARGLGLSLTDEEDR